MTELDQHRESVEILRLIEETRKFTSEQHKLIAEQQKLVAEATKYGAEQAKLAAEANKYRVERWLLPITVTAGAFGAFIAGLTIVSALLHYIGFPTVLR